jgi:DNA-binding transcriptional LysR family regulator
MDISSLRLFLRIADLGSVSAAARDQSLSPATASARLGKLEEIVGFRLFNRTTRAVSLSTDGAEFLPYAQQVLETLETGLGAVSGKGAAAQGLLRMTMPGSFGRLHIIPALAEFQERHPMVSLDLRLSDEVLDVVEGAYDLIIRNAPLADSTLVARKLASDHRLLVASPAYVARHGAPSTPDEIPAHRCVVLAENNKWKFKAGNVISAPRSIVANDGEAVRALIENGMGIGIQSLWIASEYLRDGRLVRLLPGHPLATDSDIWALYPSNRIVAPKVRAMIDFLLERFHPVPPWEH